MKFPIIYVQYLDSAVYDFGEFELDHHFELVIFDAVGWLFKEDEQAVYLAREINTTSNNKTRAILGIPKINILKRKEFTNPKTKV
ncbi:MAG: hypothetical protein U9M92_00335 [Patescibacteria group bacterium]|nr:hypothetical protein [Patescibacteria group bacterium]